MIDSQIQQFIQQEVSKQIIQQNRLNAKSILFDQNTGLATQGQNVFGGFGNRAFHNVFRLRQTEQIIDTGIITATSASILIYTEGSVASDDLDTINTQGVAYQGEEIIMLRAKDDTHTVVVKHNTGNIFLAGAADFSLDSMYDCIILRYDAIQLKWIEVLRTNVA